MARMFRFLTADEIEVKIKQVKENGLVCLLYKTARTDMDLLDETVGAGNWTNDYKEIKGNLYAGIGVIQENGGIQWKWDCGIESREDEEGNQKRARQATLSSAPGSAGASAENFTRPRLSGFPATRQK